MSIFSWIFGIQSNTENTEENISQEMKNLVEFETRLQTLLNTDNYIARRDYKFLCEDYIDLYNKFCTLKKSKTLGYYCSQNHIDIQRIEDFISIFADLSKNESAEIVTLHNKDFLDGEFCENGPLVTARY